MENVGFIDMAANNQNENIEFVDSNKGHQKLRFNGYSYNKQLVAARTVRWRCTKRQTDCRGTLIADRNGQNPRIVKQHNHDGNQAEIEAIKCRSRIKQRAKDTAEKPSQIIAQAMADVDVNVRTEMGKEDSIKRHIRKQRTNVLPAEPETLVDLKIEGEWAQTAGPNPDNFLAHDSGSDSEIRVIIFATNEAIRHLAAAQTWYMDGNFSVAPNNFSQLYVIRCPLGNTAVSTVYALLQRKSRETYEYLLNTLRQTCTLVAQVSIPQKQK